MLKRNHRNVSSVVGPLAISAICGAIFGAMAIGCSKEPAQPAPVPAVAPVAAVSTAAQPPPAARVAVPAGWRDLRFGMSEAEVRKIIRTYRADADTKWQQSSSTNLPTVRLDLRKIDNVLVDRKQFHEWSIPELDEGAEFVHAWYDDGKLVAIQLKGRAASETFVRKAADAYGSAPKNATFEFFDDRTKMRDLRSVAFWRGDDTTAFIWVTASSPTLLLWSNAAMGDHASRYQATIDAPAVAANKAEQAKENGTKF